MSAAPIVPVEALGATLLAAPASAPAAPAAPQGGFGAAMLRELSGVNQDLLRADAETRALAAGQVDNLHQVMIHLEETRLEFQLLVQVRNRVLEAYQEVMRTQV
jgi:flagellar hook-basal body complex protein FliE